MTRDQACWAAQHDWYQGCGMVKRPGQTWATAEYTVVCLQRDWDSRTQTMDERTVTFADFDAMRAWAGY